MIEQLSLKWAQWIKNNDPDGPVSYDVLLFALKVVINLFFAVFPCLIIGYFFGDFTETVTAIYAFIVLRFFSGGFHFKSLDLCAVVTVILLSSIPYIAKTGVNIYLMNFVSLVIVLFLAPSNLKNTRWTEKAKPAFKIISILIVLSNFLLNSPVVAISFIMQSLLLTFTRR
ncbi:accessory gene regulator ArgB-like protein [Paenibacillus sp. HWE-109]|uniref:accessory gene regulator ArgB-like protein n=1 Tax=Paenibacillus sp. HWE-109 TaxID=1306526 RepID=UPI003FCE6434